MTQTCTIIRCDFALGFVDCRRRPPGAPGYYVTELVGLIDGGSPAGNNSVPNAYPGSLLATARWSARRRVMSTAAPRFRIIIFARGTAAGP